MHLAARQSRLLMMAMPSVRAAEDVSAFLLLSLISLAFFFFFKDQSQLQNKEKELKKLSDLLVKLEEKSQEDTNAVKAAQDHFHAVSAGLSSNEGGEDKTLADQIMSELTEHSYSILLHTVLEITTIDWTMTNHMHNDVALVAQSMVNANQRLIPWKPIGFDTSQPTVSANQASNNRRQVGNVLPKRLRKNMMSQYTCTCTVLLQYVTQKCVECCLSNIALIKKNTQIGMLVLLC